MATALQALRSSTNLYDGVSDEGMLRHIQESYYPDKSFEEVGGMFGYSPVSTEESTVEDKPWTDDAKEIGGQLAGGLMVDFNRQVGQAAKAFTDEGSYVNDWAKGVVKRADERAPEYQPNLEGRGFLAETLIKGARSVPSSAATAGAAVLGGTIGAPVAASSLAALALFGGSQYQDTYEKAKEQGVSDEEANQAGLLTGALQGGLEAAANTLTLGALGMTGKALSKTVSGFLGKATDDAVLKPWLVATGKNVAGQVITEPMQDVGTAFVEQDYGIDKNPDYLGIAKESAQGALGMSAFFGLPGLAGHYQNAQRAKAIDTLIANPEAGTQEERLALVDMLHKEASSLNIPDADVWARAAKQDVLENNPIRRSIQPDVTDVTNASSVDEAIQAADNALRTPDARTLELRNYALESGKPAPKPTWEEPAFKINPDAEAIVRNRTVEAQPVQGFIDSRYQDTGYIPSELVFGKETTDEQRQAEADNLRDEIINRPTPKQEAINRAYYEKEQAELQQKEQDLLDAEMHPDATPAMVKQYRKARAEIETQRRQRADDFRKGLGFNIVPATTGEARNTQLADKLAQALSPKQQETRNKLNAVKLNAKTVLPQETQPATQETASVPTTESQISPEVTDAAYSTGTTTENNSAATSPDRAVTPENTGVGRAIDDGGNGLTGRGTRGNADGLSRDIQQSTVNSEPGRALEGFTPEETSAIVNSGAKNYTNYARARYGAERIKGRDLNKEWDALNGKGQNKTTQATEEAVSSIIPPEQTQGVENGTGTNFNSIQTVSSDKQSKRNGLDKDKPGNTGNGINGSIKSKTNNIRNGSTERDVTYLDKSLETAKKDLDYAQQQHTEKENMYAVATQKGIKPEQRRENLKAQFGLNDVQAEVITDIALKGKETFMRGTSESLKQATENLRKTEKAIEDEQTQAPIPRTDTSGNETPVGSSKAEPDVLGEEEVRNLSKQFTGSQETNQKRAAAGGEIGPNGEFYKGGAFIATTDLPKKIKIRIQKHATGQEQFDIGVGKQTMGVPKPGEMPIVRAGFLGTAVNPQTGELNEQFIKYNKFTDKEISQIKELRDKWLAGEKYVNVYDYPNLANVKDAARLAINGLPIPEELLSRFPLDIQENIRKYSKSSIETQTTADSSKTEPTIDDIPEEFKDKVKYPIAQGDKTIKVSASELIKDLDKIIADYKKFIECMGGK